MSKNRELDILANLFNKLSDEEKEELLDLVDKKTSDKTDKQESHNKFFDMDLSEENTKFRTLSKKLNKTTIKHSPRKQIKFIKVKCENCGKEHEVAENFPGLPHFICCI